MNKLEGVVVVHFDGDGDWSYHVFGEKVRLFIVDDRAPNDRVYEYLSRSEPSYLRDLIPAGSDIGNQNDERHEAIKHRVLAAGEGRSHLSLVESDHE